jgi:polyhydroxybutyrate depolymerase
MTAILSLMAIREHLAKFIRRHKVALVGLLLGAIILQVAQVFSGTGDYSFQQSSSATAVGTESTIKLAGDRSADLILPKSYSENVSTPLLINLHGYTGTGPSQSAYTFLQEAAFNSGVAYIAPTGSEDNLGNTYWNATEACCDFNNSGVDDVAYIDSLIERSLSAANIDPARIYIFGHSNGHFMAYAYLCGGSQKIAAVAGLAGAMEPDATFCKAKPANILHIHGEKDETILYLGGALFGNAYTSAKETISQWQTINKCSAGTEAPLDLLNSIPGVDTKAKSFKCENGALDFWSLPNGTHTPNLDIDFANQLVNWFLSHAK